ncbi:MAG: protein kinase [Lentisphaeraceae bacterium]|nr:protein kinase [Lentisphaeraceae bacterium]
MGIKFQCHECHGIVATEYDDELVMCGHCEATCQVPREFGPGVVIDDFAILSLLGQGGMGDVYLSHQFSLDREVALKILKDKFLEDPKFSEEFVQEARSVASLNHPNIIRAYKVGFDQEKLFFAMEYVEGQNLNDILKTEGALDPARVIDISIDVVEALGYAWETSKLIHRDIKPDNIMISNDGTAKVMDLGLSRRADGDYDDSDIISGTPQYISPEQIMGDEMDIRGDFYSLGATMYHLVSGRFIFDGTLEEMIKKHMTEKPLSLKQTAPHVDESLGKIIRKLLAKKPENRYLDAKSLVADLRKAAKAQLGTTTKRHITVKNLSGITTRGGTTSTALRKPTREAKTAVRMGKRKGSKDDKKDSKAKIIMAVGAGALLFGIILLAVLSGSSDKTSKPASSTAAVAQPAEPVLSPIEKKAMAHPSFKKALPVSGLNRSLYYSYYEGAFNNLGMMLKKSPKAQGTTKKLTLSNRKKNDKFGFVFEGYLLIPKTSIYTYYLSSDDGSRLFIDSEKVIDNDGKHGMEEKKGTIALEKGVHAYRVEFFQHTSGFGFEHKVESLELPKQDVPYKWFRSKPK